MLKTTIYLPDDLKRGIHRLAEQRGVSDAEVIRASLWDAVSSSAPNWDALPTIDSPELAAVRDDEAYLRDTGFGS